MARKKPLPPRRKRMKRPARLQSAVSWLPTYSGKNVVRGYARWYGVDFLCAVKELTMLGRPASAAYVDQLRKTMEEREKAAQRRRAKLIAAQAEEREWQELCDWYEPSGCFDNPTW